LEEAAWAVGRAEPEAALPEPVEADPDELRVGADGELPDPPAEVGVLDFGVEPLEPELGALVTGVEGSDGSCF
jgi:hypothetical protein